MRCVREADLAAARAVDEVVALDPGHAVDEIDAGEALQRTDVAHDEVNVVRRAADSSVELQPRFTFRCHICRMSDMSLPSEARSARWA